MSQVTLEGNPVELIGDLPAIGSTAPDFMLTAGNLSDASLSNYAGKKIVLNIVPSLDTPTCAASARKFNQEISERGDSVCLVVSADLPFAQGRFCTTEGLENIVPLSMMRNKNFAKDYGVLITGGPLEGLAARAIVVIDTQGKVSYTQLVPEIVDEPDYDAALKALN
jgi:thiol peroxidase